MIIFIYYVDKRIDRKWPEMLTWRSGGPLSASDRIRDEFERCLLKGKGGEASRPLDQLDEGWR